ncbi:MAG: hypothetical protein JRF59_10500 [Deltaproteobacteria bacterium]|nr:hypothetical protein [Deltaproteobacteria bacterium]MBW1924135.1 hypothetical protein [Deltaproteobacteria bacterium]MBW1950076.1 hypothetical protein [Deltaproteobacteria bacterium]MBW2009325.1 hypothetical protein [Deltaproteobacteria bacterium]MBW2102256.1 hypothetical protein [Deltaproteobacteria bacterium]
MDSADAIRLISFVDPFGRRSGKERRRRRSDEVERRSGLCRRSTVERRSTLDRRANHRGDRPIRGLEPLWSPDPECLHRLGETELPICIIGPDRRSGTERRSGMDRRDFTIF